MTVERFESCPPSSRSRTISRCRQSVHRCVISEIPQALQMAFQPEVQRPRASSYLALQREQQDLLLRLRFTRKPNVAAVSSQMRPRTTTLGGFLLTCVNHHFQKSAGVHFRMHRHDCQAVRTRCSRKTAAPCIPCPPFRFLVSTLSYGFKTEQATLASAEATGFCPPGLLFINNLPARKKGSRAKAQVLIVDFLTAKVRQK